MSNEIKEIEENNEEANNCVETLKELFKGFGKEIDKTYKDK